MHRGMMTHLPSAIGLSPRQLDTLDQAALDEQAAHEIRVLAEAHASDERMLHANPMSPIGAFLFDYGVSMNRAMATVYAGGVTTDDAIEVASLVNEIAEQPHQFAARYLELERRVSTIEAGFERSLKIVQVTK
jgi:hypothetical protein